MSCRHQLRLLVRSALDLASSLGNSFGDNNVSDIANVNSLATNLAHLVAISSSEGEKVASEQATMNESTSDLTLVLSERILDGGLAAHLLSLFSSSASLTQDQRLLLKLAKALDQRDTHSLASMRLSCARSSKFVGMLEEKDDLSNNELNSKQDSPLPKDNVGGPRNWTTMSISTDESSESSMQPIGIPRVEAMDMRGSTVRVEQDGLHLDVNRKEHYKGHKRSVSEPKWYEEVPYGRKPLMSLTPSIGLQSHDDWSTPSTSSVVETDPLGVEESNWQLVSPPTSGWTMPLPSSRDQSLASYLGSLEFSRHQAQLDRENAHFILAEAVMQAANKAKFDMNKTNASAKTDKENNDNANDEIIEKEVKNDSSGCKRGGNCGGEATSAVSSSPSYEPNNNLTAESSKKGDNAQSFYRRSKTFSRSAQSIALQLLPSADNGLTTTKVSDLDWLITQDSDLEEKEEVPRVVNGPKQSDTERGTLLRSSRFESADSLHSSPLKSLTTTTPSSQSSPSSTSPLSSSSSALATTSFDHDLRPTAIRGTQQWAPPRPQLILVEHKKIKIRDGLECQGYRCAGCGMSVSPKYMNTFRMCHYFGKFFCTNCHLGQVSILPSKVVRQWDFREFPVSNFAKSVINSLSRDHLFDLPTINPRLIDRVVRVRSAVFWRQKAILVFPYIFTCTNKGQDIERLQSEASNYRLTESSVFSLHELCYIKLGSYLRQLVPLVKEARRHVLQCQTCHLHGHLCEGCHRSDVLFPFESDRVSQCSKCRGCFHLECSPSNNECPKCHRIQKRHQARAANQNL